MKSSNCEPFVFNRVGLNELNGDNPFTLFPNPNDGSFQVDFGQAINVGMKVYSNTGQLVQSQNKLSGLRSIELNVQPGVYLIEFEHEGSKSFQQLIVY